ncbi:DUF4384 domain-containing protein [Treponema sp. OttesenSCG-928-L16]|nr:DUF4384 domain-containing protein [Treponema sp. OttesenSCG-928-L16]
MRSKWILIILFIAAFPLVLFSQSLDAQIDVALNGITANISRPYTVGIGPIVIAESNSSSSFADYLKTKISSLAVNQRNLRIVPDSVINDFLERTNFVRTRSIDPMGPQKTSSNTPADMQAILDGTYYIMNESVELTLFLTSKTTGTVMGSHSLVFSRESLDKMGLSYLPPAVASLEEYKERTEILNVYNGDKNPFRLEVVPKDGKVVYKPGNEMSFSIYSEEDVWVLVYFVMGSNEPEPLFPNYEEATENINFIRAGATMRLPQRATYRVQNDPGEEYILVQAYTEPFDIPDAFWRISDTNTPQHEVKITRGAVSRGLRVVAAQPEPAATAMFNYTILPK